ncbi:hypothetical protein ONS95_002431 [Cadophora gregata]|uniref:uncharacterized protein n=1 Tax=Cadophora gregata TaxID=51156 RepID=UPI0026DD3D7E|nr:uncharacterized protein ONS95_002431 [Cadophora gregata]KAK0109755.1 hypothetical protein ONS95_002431 [Cadophora gregata]KAK0110616.1 hypothetical protein ONS96_002219 [Cadophora gregata f. sp. sojae]
MTAAISILNGSVAATVGWVSGPDGRGTFSLVVSCLLTLGLCVWSAMHLNISPHNESLTKSWFRHLKWGLIGIFAPELVVFAAWRQYNFAKELHKRMNHHISETKEKTKSSTERRHPWTTVHSFYAGMGGFIIQPGDLCKDEGQQYIPGDQYLTLSARGIAFLAGCGHLPDIPEDEIVDKSKADGLAKTLVCLQAGWMVVQVIARAILGLPVTLLEVNTIAHVFCALVVYILWWHKPRLVHEPTAISGDWIKPLCAYMFMSSQISGSKRNHAGALWQAWVQPEASAVGFFTRQGKVDISNTGLFNVSSADQETRSLHPQASHDATQDEDAIRGSAIEPSNNTTTCYFALRPSRNLPSQPSPHEAYTLVGVVERAQTPAAMQAERWKLAAEAVRLYPFLCSRYGATNQTEPQWTEMVPEELITRSASNWPAEDLLRGTEGLIMGMTLWCLSVAYGAIHIAAWNDYFTSVAEQWLWHASAVYISFSGLLWLFINLIAHEWKAVDAYWDRVLMYEAHWISYASLGVVCSLCGIAYISARTYLVLEAFISIRELPLAAYNTPDWMTFFPSL